MKYILVILLAFTVSAAAFAQTKPAANQKASADTTLVFKLTGEQTRSLLGALQTTYGLLPRSADLSALQASEMQKQVLELGNVLTEQLPKPKPAKKDTTTK